MLTALFRKAIIYTCFDSAMQYVVGPITVSGCKLCNIHHLWDGIYQHIVFSDNSMASYGHNSNATDT